MAAVQYATNELAEKAGFATFNPNPHMCIDIPDGWFTISVKTSNGRKVAFAFVPYVPGGPASCIDISQADAHGLDEEGHPIQRVLCLSAGRTPYKSSLKDEVTIVSMLLDS